VCFALFTAQTPSLTRTELQAERLLFHRGMEPSAADAASRRRRGTLASVLAVFALLLVLASSVAEAVSSASLLTFDSPWRNPLYAEVRGGVDKSALGDARQVHHSVRLNGCLYDRNSLCQELH
jgi:hypothetical protein